jgi:hypothetical protein
LADFNIIRQNPLSHPRCSGAVRMAITLTESGGGMKQRILLGLFLPCLLAGNSALAAPPVAPRLELHGGGLDVSLSWTPVADASGYRLFYADYPGGGNLGSVDLGAATTFSSRLWDGAAFYVAVTAYNGDGSSLYSNIEAIHALDPQSQPLQFQFVKLDTPVAFLPEAEAEAEAMLDTRSIASGGANPGVDYEDGLIGMTAHIAPGLVERDNLPLSFCLDSGQICEALEVWNSDQQAYAGSLTVSKVYTDVETSVYLQLRLPDGLVEKLRPQLSQPATFTIRATLLDSPNIGNIGVELARVDLVNLPPSTRRQTRANLGLKFGKDFTKTFANNMFGIGFTVGGEAFGYLREIDNPADSTKKKTIPGGSVSVSGELTPQIFGNDINGLIEVGGYLLRDGNNPFHANFAVSLLAREVLNKNWEYSSTQRKFVPTTTKREIPTVPNTLDLSNLGDLFEAVQGVPTFGSGLDSLGLSYAKEQFVQSRFVVGIIPISVKGGVRAELGLAGSVGMRFGVDTAARKVTQLAVFASGVGPQFTATAFASASVDIIVASAGVGADLRLLSEGLGVDTELDLLKVFAQASNRSADDGIRITVKNILLGPAGQVYVFASWTVPRFCFCRPLWTTKSARKNLVNWDAGLRIETIIFRR